MRYTKRQLLNSLDTFTRSYLGTLLWSSGDEISEGPYSLRDCSKALILTSIVDCKRFQEENSELLGHEEVSLDRAGHDFALTRNNHGAGFWDGDYPMTGDALTAACSRYPEVYLYLHRGRVYHT